MAEKAEILVHIAAPSTSTDDALYRAFAQAYLDFEPEKRIELPSFSEPQVAPPSSDELFSPQLSFNSVWENIKSPVLARVKKSDNTHLKAIEYASQDERQSQEPWVPPPSEIQDSMPDNDITMEGFNTPTRILKYFLQSTEPFSQTSQDIDDGRKDTTVYNGDGDFTSLTTQKITSNLAKQQPETTEAEPQGNHNTRKPHHSPFSKLLEEILGETTVVATPTNRSTRPNQLKEALGETTVIETPLNASSLRKKPTSGIRSSAEKRSRSTDTSPRSSESKPRSFDRVIPSTQLPGRAESEPPSCKRPRLDRPEQVIQGLGRSASDIVPQGSLNAVTPSTNVSRDEVEPTERLDIDWSHETHIVSKEPTPSNHKLGPSPPMRLEMLCKRLEEEEGRYKPKFQAREMRPYERGYWLLNIDGWDHDAKVEAWAFLGNFIRRDSRAGWGTRACRDEQWRSIRLYGWEHIAKELYFLLYVAAYRRTKYMELTWYDGANKELIVAAARMDKALESRQ